MTNTATASAAPVRLAQRLLAEFVGTAFLLVAVVGSGVMAERLTNDVAIQLLANSTATAGALLALILALGPVSGAHFNPVVSLADRVRGVMDSPTLAQYVVVQIAGSVTGVIVANLMFDLPAVNISTKDRGGFDLVLSEGVATLGLIIVIFGVVNARKSEMAAITVAGYIGGAYWFTSSTSFANPAVTIGRTLSNTFAGIDPSYVIGFVTAQVAGAILGIGLMQFLAPAEERESAR